MSSWAREYQQLLLISGVYFCWCSWCLVLETYHWIQTSLWHVGVHWGFGFQTHACCQGLRSPSVKAFWDSSNPKFQDVLFAKQVATVSQPTVVIFWWKKYVEKKNKTKRSWIDEGSVCVQLVICCVNCRFAVSLLRCVFVIVSGLVELTRCFLCTGFQTPKKTFAGLKTKNCLRYTHPNKKLICWSQKWRFGSDSFSNSKGVDFSGSRH